MVLLSRTYNAKDNDADGINDEERFSDYTYTLIPEGLKYIVNQEFDGKILKSKYQELIFFLVLMGKPTAFLY